MQRNYQGEKESWRKYHLFETNTLHVTYGPLLFNIHAWHLLESTVLKMNTTFLRYSYRRGS